MENTSFYITKLRQEFADRQRENASYSLRAFARDMDVHHSTMSHVIRGKRSLPANTVKSLVSKIELSPQEKTLFLESFHRSITKIDQIQLDEEKQRYMLDEAHFRIVAEWEHYAVFQLCDLSDFDFRRPSDITKKIGITTERSQTVLRNLVTAGLLEKNEEGRYVKSHPSIRTTEDIKSLALKKSHRETLELAKEKLEIEDSALRDFSAVTVTMDMEKMDEAKTIIREFRRKMAALLEGGNKQHVYRLAIQFFPLTKIGKSGVKK